MEAKRLKNMHPDEILLKEFLLLLEKLAGDISFSPRRINEIVHCKLSADLHLAKALEASEGFWLRLQLIGNHAN